MSEILFFEQICPTDAPLVGGKALSLARLTQAGFPVPWGFCLTVQVYQRWRENRLHEASWRHSLADACARLGSGWLAVRSSMTTEDGRVHSFAGQQETILGVRGLEDVLQAIERCWTSLDSERARAYRLHLGLRESSVQMAVIVQRLIEAEVAGVLFTKDPLDPTGERMLIEASWGLGESVVSGRVSPDRFHLDRSSGRVREQHLGPKEIKRTAKGEERVPSELQRIPCLHEKQLQQLVELGLAVERFEQEPRDLEWAFALGQCWLVQSRPITVGGLAEREQVRLEEIASLRRLAASGATVWARVNLAEVLPTPTPLTWELLRCYLLSPKGGMGFLYQDLGYYLDSNLEEGFFDLICGRPYCNLHRQARWHESGLPLEYSLKQLKAEPYRAFDASPRLNLLRLPWHNWLFFPFYLGRLALRLFRGARQRAQQARRFALRFSQEIVPAFIAEAHAAATVDLGQLDVPSLLAFFDHWARRTLVEFARESLKPTAFAALEMASLERKLAQVLGNERAHRLIRELIVGVRPAPERDLASALPELAAGKISREEFLDRFGHRGPEEMELASPRWAEAPDLLDRMKSLPQTGEAKTWEDYLRSESRLNSEQQQLVRQDLARLHDFIRWREAGKHYLLLGYALIRKALVELDHRYKLDGGIFFLMPQELASLAAGEDLTPQLEQRRRRRTLALGLEAPAVLFSDDLDVLGRPLPLPAGQILQGVALSPGVSEAPALVLEQRPSFPLKYEEYILVCPSTDPAWIPLFGSAKGLVLEVGGVLSHGAIVAREFGLPAVAGLPGILRRVRTGQRLQVDGTRGIITIIK